MTFLNWLDRWALTCRLKLRERCAHRAARVSPAAFRRDLLLPGTNPVAFSDVVQPWQQRDFAALDACWLQLAGHRVSGPVAQRAYIERPRGHSKTSDMAVQIAWILIHAPRPLQGLAAAADREQAGLIWEAVQRIARTNRYACRALEFRKHVIVNRETGSRLDVISSDVQSSWGALPDFVICDELCHWEKPQMWHSLLSSAAKRPHCVLIVLTNAGVGRGWQWEVRESARQSPGWYFSTLDDCRAPWISLQWLDEQRALLPPPVFERLWRNRWQHSDGEFITLAEAESCRDESLLAADSATPGTRYVAAIDYAEKHDYTVGVLVHEAGNRIIVDRMDVAVPTVNQPVRVEWVENWIADIAGRFGDVTFVVDEYQLLGTIQRLEKRFDIHRFEFGAGKGNHALAVNLRNLLVHRQLAWPADCGAIACAAGRDDLETELASLLLKQSATGRVRIDHRSDGQHHDDRAFALGAACLYLRQDAPADDWLEITPDGLFED